MKYFLFGFLELLEFGGTNERALLLGVGKRGTLWEELQFLHDMFVLLLKGKLGERTRIGIFVVQ